MCELSPWRAGGGAAQGGAGSDNEYRIVPGVDNSLITTLYQDMDDFLPTVREYFLFSTTVLIFIKHV